MSSNKNSVVNILFNIFSTATRTYMAKHISYLLAAQPKLFIDGYSVCLSGNSHYIKNEDVTDTLVSGCQKVFDSLPMKVS